MDYYSIPPEKFASLRSWRFNFVQSTKELNELAARSMVDLIHQNNHAGKTTMLILPTGPLHFRPFAELCNLERVSLKNLVIYLMDEYIGEDGKAIREDHPLSFTANFRRVFCNRLDPELGFNFSRVKVPTPENMEQISREILDSGGADLCFCGIGISGHLAFNDPPELNSPRKDLDWLRNTTARIVELSRETNTQMALAGTHGNWAVIPRRAVTLGIRELLSAHKLHMTFMRSWHAGMCRRAMFGPVSVDCPASLIQEHPNVEVTCTPTAAQVPVLNVTLDVDD